MKRIILAATAVVLLLSACGPKEANTASSGPQLKIVNVGVTNDPGTLHPLTMVNVMAQATSGIFFMPLSGVTINNEIVYRFAESITTTDNTTFTIRVNPRIKWSDGVPASADDVIFTLNTIANPAVGVQDPSYINIIVGTEVSGLWSAGATELSGVKRIDDLTLTVETKYPMTTNMFTLLVGSLLRVMPKHIVEKEAPENIMKSPFFQNPTVSCGPFKFKEYVASQYISLEAYDDYYLGRPKIDILNFKILSGTQITAQLESGELDMNWPSVGFLPTDDYDRIIAMDHLRTARGAPGVAQVLFYNSKFFPDARVRMAMDLAIDRDSIKRNIFKGEAYMTRIPLTNQIEYWNEAAAAYTFDVEQGKRLLAEAGWDLSKKITFLVPTGNSTRERICTIVGENLKALGLNVVIEKADFPTTLGRVQKQDYDMAMIGIPDQPLNAVQNLRYFLDSKTGWTGYSNLRADELLTSISTSVDTQALRQDYFAIQDLLAVEVPVSNAYCELALRAINKRVLYGELEERGYLLDLEKWDVQ
ncbi:peptide ABC transporter substrate-binding protein [Spirochaetia bacterium]|nr:peptide ABC transporter substrate-binding protein [Spirochaetia bacterium]